MLSKQGCPSRVSEGSGRVSGCRTARWVGVRVLASRQAKEQPALVCVLTPASQGASLSAGATPRTQHSQAEHLNFFPKPACLPARSGAKVLQSPIYNTSHVTPVAAPPALPFSVGPGLSHLSDWWHGLRNPPPLPGPRSPGSHLPYTSTTIQPQSPLPAKGTPLLWASDAWGSRRESQLTRPTVGSGLGLRLHTLTYTCVPQGTPDNTD